MTTLGCLAEGARRLARRKAVVAWIYVAYLALGFIAMLLASSALTPVLGYSLYSDRLVHGMDLVALLEMMSRPEFKPGAAMLGSLLAAGALGLGLLVATPGICAEFLAEQPIGVERFFLTCGHFLWRFVRLVAVTLAIFLPTLALLNALRGALTKAADASENMRLPFIVFVAMSVVLQLVALTLRAWFDTAEFELISANHIGARRSLGMARRMTSGFRLRLLGMYLVPAIVLWGITALLFFAWLHIPPARTGITMLVGQLLILTWISARLWQRASQAAWYQTHLPPVPEPPAIPPEALAAEAPVDTESVEADLP